MRRSKPTKKLDKIGKLGKSPEDAVEDFKAARAHNEFFVKPPNWDSPGDSIELLLLQSKREHTALRRMQKEMLEDKKRTVAINERRERILGENLTELRNRFLKANKFIKVCQEKESIAELKADEQLHMQKQLREDIVKSRQAIGEFSKFTKRLGPTVEEYEHYEALLEDVVAARPEVYDSVKDCTDRCDALMMAQEQILAIHQQKWREIEEMRQLIVQAIDNVVFEVMGMRNELAAIERAHQEANNMCLKWERHLANAQNNVADHQLMKERTYDGLRDIYLLLCRRRGIEPVYQRWEGIKMSNFIKEEVEFLGDLLQDLELRRDGARANDDDLC